MFSRPRYAIDSAHALPQALGRAMRDTADFAGMTFWTDAAVLGGAGSPSCAVRARRRRSPQYRRIRRGSRTSSMPRRAGGARARTGARDAASMTLAARGYQAVLRKTSRLVESE